jgi:hypothetical protein
LREKQPHTHTEKRTVLLLLPAERCDNDADGKQQQQQQHQISMKHQRRQGREKGGKERGTIT